MQEQPRDDVRLARAMARRHGGVAVLAHARGDLALLAPKPLAQPMLAPALARLRRQAGRDAVEHGGRDGVAHAATAVARHNSMTARAPSASAGSLWQPDRQVSCLSSV